MAHDAGLDDDAAGVGGRACIEASDTAAAMAPGPTPPRRSFAAVARLRGRTLHLGRETLSLAPYPPARVPTPSRSHLEIIVADDHKGLADRSATR
ncbi:hypothetical protein EBBID32_10350 [Sphingobium indicum BiD32]|uniref:Uncharacterized protein n=1 Tax=Sphingobium indicum BiD32 TaxID=1301087 RepID=N1MM89_9SPHN|nr:hypothetical protein EBBID32_10350 [Sphingobium indicum BiD32]